MTVRGGFPGADGRIASAGSSVRGFEWRHRPDESKHDQAEERALRERGSGEQQPRHDTGSLRIDYEPQPPTLRRRDRLRERYDGCDTRVIEAHETDDDDSSQHGPGEALDASLPGAG